MTDTAELKPMVHPLSQEQKEACGCLAHNVLGGDSFTSEHARIILSLLADYERRHKVDADALSSLVRERDEAREKSGLWAGRCGAEFSRAEADAARMREALEPFAAIPLHGAFGGPLVGLLPRYEDGSNGDMLGHEPVRRTRASLSNTSEGGKDAV